MSSRTQVVFSGVGAVCGAGLGAEMIWKAIEDGRSAIQPITQWDASRWPIRVAAEVTGVEDRTLVPDRKLHKLISRTDLFGLYAAGTAIHQSGLPDHRARLNAKAADLFNDRSGVFAGSGGGNYSSNYDFFPALTAAQGDLGAFGREVADTVNPMWLLRHLPNNVVCHAGIQHNFKGTNACITNQCVGGAMAVREAAAAIQAGEADRAVAIGHDAPIEPETVFDYHRLGLLGTEALRPFDQDRNGTIFGEGAAAVLLETAADAQARHAPILGEFLGSGCTCEGTGILAVRPDGDGLSRAIEMALEDAAVPHEAVGMIVAHGNGTQTSDASEVNAIKRVFGNAPPPITGFKWAVGHLIAASGILDMVLALNALNQQVVPGIATLVRLDQQFAPFPVAREPQSPRSDIALVLCRGVGGMNVALVVRGTRAIPQG